MGKVFVKAVPRESAQKRKSFINHNGQRKTVDLAKAKGTNGQGVFRFVVNQHKPRLLNTGFEKRVENPWFENASNLPMVWQNKNIGEKQEISRQEYFEIKLQLEPGTLHSRVKKLFDKDDKISWIQKWERDFIDTVVLDLDDPNDELTYWLLQQSSPDKCANSVDEINPHTRVYISQVNEDAERKAKKSELIEGGIAKLVMLKTEHSEMDQFKLATVMKIVKGSVSPAKVKEALSDYITLPNPKQLDRIKEFGKVYDLLKDAKGKDILETRYILQACINNRIISDYQGKYIWSSKKGTAVELIGKSENEALEWLNDIDSRHYREELEEELKAKIDDDRLMAL